MTTATFSHQPYRPGVVRLRVGRLVACIILVMALVVGGGLWFLHAYGRKVTTKPVDTTMSPPWMKQGITYPPDAQAAEKAAAQNPDRSAEILRQLAALQQQLSEQQAAIEALKRKPSTVINQQPAQAAKATPATEHRPPGTMLFISHDLKETPPDPKVTEYTLAPGATKLACQIETAMNSDVEGYFTAKVTTNVYDTATGQHLLVPQGSTILGNDQSSQLLYGNERMDTISLKLTLPDGRTVDLGKAPVTDQQGVAGLTGRVDQHYWRLFGAVFIGGALKGGMTAMQTAMTSAAGAGQVTTGIATVGNQATNRVIGPLLNTRPTIEVDAGQLCNVLLLQPLHLPAMWQGGRAHDDGEHHTRSSEVSMPHQTYASHRHITVHHVHHERPRLNGCLALFLLCGTAVGVLFFGTIALVNFHHGNVWLTLVGLAGIGGLVYGLFSYLRPYA